MTRSVLDEVLDELESGLTPPTPPVISTEELTPPTETKTVSLEAFSQEAYSDQEEVKELKRSRDALRIRIEDLQATGKVSRSVATEMVTIWPKIFEGKSSIHSYVSAFTEAASGVQLNTILHDSNKVLQDLSREVEAKENRTKKKIEEFCTSLLTDSVLSRAVSCINRDVERYRSNDGWFSDPVFAFAELVTKHLVTDLTSEEYLVSRDTFHPNNVASLIAQLRNKALRGKVSLDALSEGVKAVLDIANSCED